MLLIGKKSSFALEDMMRVIWPSAQPGDIKEMRRWCKEFSRSVDMKRIKAPPVLPDEEYEGLMAVFRYFGDGSGEVHIDALVAKGLVYEEQAAQVFQEWDKDGSGTLDAREFCEMMCPCGYRATQEAETGCLENGMRALYDPKLGCWRIDDESEGGHDQCQGEGGPPPEDNR